jgi:hypothetical protein
MVALKDPQPPVRRHAAALAPFYADATLSKVLVSLGQDDADDAVRQAATEALIASTDRLG